MGGPVANELCTRRETILITVDDLVADFLYFDRKKDSKLPVGQIETAIRVGDITAEDIVEQFRAKLVEGLSFR